MHFTLSEIRTMVNVLERETVIDSMRQEAAATESEGMRRKLQATLWKDRKEQLEAVGIWSRRETRKKLFELLRLFPSLTDIKICGHYYDSLNNENPLVRQRGFSEST